MRLFAEHFGTADGLRVARAPGRVNLIGDHTDYNGLPVFPMAIQRAIRMVFRERQDASVHLASTDGYAAREFPIAAEIDPYAAGDWGNYIKASARTLARRYGQLRGIDALICGDIPPAAGLSSSSALVVAAALALLGANRIEAGFDELMELLPEGEQYVGTRGGAMDHAICLAGEEGKAVKIDFKPLLLHRVAVPADWRFLIGHSLVRAEKSSGAREIYNARREACRRALANLAGDLTPEEQRCALHILTEAGRVEQALAAMRAADIGEFGTLMNASHASLRDQFEVSHPEVDRLVEAFLAAGAAGARVTGAGLGGCVVALCQAADADRVCAAVEESFYQPRPERQAFPEYLLQAKPSPGARVYEV